MAKERHREKERKRDRKGETLNHLSIHQWVRSAIFASHQLTSPIGFPFLKLPPPPCAVLLVLFCFVLLCIVMLCCVVLCNVMYCFAMYCYVMYCYVRVVTRKIVPQLSLTNMQHAQMLFRMA